MDAVTTFIVAFLFLLISFLTFSLVSEHIKSKRNKHLNLSFFSHLGADHSKNNPLVIHINEKLYIEIFDSLFTTIDVFVKDKKGDFVKVETKTRYMMKQPSYFTFSEPWHEDISAHFKVLYDEFNQQALIEKQNHNHKIDEIKSNY